MEFFGFLAWPISWILTLFYNLFDSYGLAIIILTVIIRLCLFPLTLKQMRSQRDMQRLQPKIKEIEKRYKGDKQAIQQETMALYKQEGVSMTGGCWPMFIQLFVIMGLYQAIYRPLYYMYKFSKDEIAALSAAYGIEGNVNEATIASMMQQDPSKMAGIVENYEAFEFIDFNFLGIDLALTPGVPDFTNFSTFFGSATILWVIPLFAFVTGILSSVTMKFTMPQSANAKDNPAAAQAERMSKMMIWVMPIMSIYFAFILPTAIGLYWGIANLLAAVQQVAIRKMLSKEKPVDLDEKVMEKRTKKRAAQDEAAGISVAAKQRPEGQRPKRPEGQRPAGQRPQGQRPAGQRPQGQRPKPAGAESNAEAPKEKKPARMPGQRVERAEGEASPMTREAREAAAKKQAQQAAKKPQTQRPRRPEGQRPPQRKLGERPADKPKLPPKEVTTPESQVQTTDKGGDVTDDKN